MSGDSIFAEEWRDCLKSHYMHVVREQDVKTERTLRSVMQNVGFSESELNELRVLATMHIDDVDADFVPDLGILESPVAAIPSDDLETDLPLQDDMPQENTDAVGAQYIVSEVSDETSEEEVSEVEEPPRYNETGPQQISLF